jgi:hypothetical protein
LCKPLPLGGSSAVAISDHLCVVLSINDRGDAYGAVVSCTASMWRVTPTRIKCLCRSLLRLSWDGRQEPTLFCGGREAAIARLDDHTVDKNPTRSWSNEST